MTAKTSSEARSASDGLRKTPPASFERKKRHCGPPAVVRESEALSSSRKALRAFRATALRAALVGPRSGDSTASPSRRREPLAHSVRSRMLVAPFLTRYTTRPERWSIRASVSATSSSSTAAAGRTFSVRPLLWPAYSASAPSRASGLKTREKKSKAPRAFFRFLFSRLLFEHYPSERPEIYRRGRDQAARDLNVAGGP